MSSAPNLKKSWESPRNNPPAPRQAQVTRLSKNDPVTDPTSDPRSDAELVAQTLEGQTSAFEVLIARYQPRVFSTVRRYSRREDEVEDVAQEIFIKAYEKLRSFRGEAPFEHWLMRLAVRTCYDFLRSHRRNRETTFTEFTREESDWLERFQAQPQEAPETDVGARELLNRVLAEMSPEYRLVIQLLEIEDRSVRDIADLTGWSETLVKVRAFRARKQMRKRLERWLNHNDL
jgi:RNA polymerase sigma-70 factor (ECF subfamily)